MSEVQGGTLQYVARELGAQVATGSQDWHLSLGVLYPSPVGAEILSGRQCQNGLKLEECSWCLETCFFMMWGITPPDHRETGSQSQPF